jgi:hypothetical protein
VPPPDYLWLQASGLSTVYFFYPQSLPASYAHFAHNRLKDFTNLLQLRHIFAKIVVYNKTIITIKEVKK